MSRVNLILNLRHRHGRPRTGPAISSWGGKKKKREEKEIQSPTSPFSSKKVLNRVLCVVCLFVQGSIVMFLLKKCVLNYINGEPVFHRNGTFLN